jgi:hypothetical protein
MSILLDVKLAAFVDELAGFLLQAASERFVFGDFHRAKMRIAQ